MWKYALAAFGGAIIGVVGGVFLEKMLRSLKENRLLKCEELLKKNFGEPIYVSKFTAEEVKEWILGRKSAIESGSKAVVMKVNKDSFAKISSDLVIEESLNNYLLLVMYKDGDLSDTLLVKYETLDDSLKEQLQDGIMVVE
jgi:hypothetical protein